MPNTMSSYLAFNGQAREALEFYATVFGGTPRFTTFGDMGAGADGMGPADSVMHGQLTTDEGWTLMAADSTRPEDEVVRGGSSLTIWGDDVDRGTRQFEQLAEGGTVEMPLEKQMWGDTYGGLRDRFGISWGFNLGPQDGSQA